MHVGLEVSAAATPYPGGIHRYITSLTKALAQREGIQISLWYRLSRWKQRRHWWRPEGFVTRTYQGRWWPPYASVDLVHGLDGSLPDWPRVPRVATVIDLAVLKPEFRAFSSDSFQQAKRARYGAMLRRADRLIAISECTKRDLVELLGAKADGVRVIPLGVDARFKPLPAERVKATLKAHKLEPGYLLYVGVVSQRKNTERLVRAYGICDAAKDRPLVLAGRVYHRSGETLRAIEKLNPGRDVLLPGPVPEEDLPALYNGAAALLFPTLYEGFGLPILEAMACGVPVLCADRGGAAEVAQAHAIRVDPESVDAIGAGIGEVLAMGRARRDAARRYARGYTWTACAERTSALYRELV